jgi:uncharacterized protein (TIGR00730 family)
MKVITVFGSSAPVAGEPAYEQAWLTGRLLAESGYAVATGGYIGTMEAVSRGAAAAGGHVIGVTSAQIEAFRTGSANPYVIEEIKYDTLRDRLLHLVLHNDGMIALPGGVGTLSEVTLAWSFIQVGEIPPRPLVLLGQLWRDTLAAFVQPAYVPAKYAALVRFADSPLEAVNAVTRSMPHAGGEG